MERIFKLQLHNRILKNARASWLSRSFNFMFYVICFILAIMCFYFAISENLFYWFYGDELGAASIYASSGGLWGCTKSYYFHTSLNRFSAAFGTCLIAQIGHVFNMQYMVWVLGRLIYFVLTPISMAYLFKETIKIPFKLALCISFLLFAIAYFVMMNRNPFSNMYIICLAIYAASTITFFTLVALFKKSITNIKYFIYFCLFFAINLNAHEVFLVISGFFIPLFAWYKYKEQFPIKQNRSFRAFIAHALRYRAIWVLLFIYMCSALAEILAPGVKIRQQIWPSTGTLQDGIGYTFLSVVNTVNVIINFHIISIITLLLGITAGISNVKKKINNYYLLYSFLFCAPFIYLFVTSYLLGITPTLFAPSSQPSHEFVQNFRDLLVNFVTNKTILDSGAGGLAFRQSLFLYVSLYVNIFMAGFFLSRWVAKYFINLTNFKAWPIKLALISILTMFILFNPDGINSLRILHAFFNPGEITLTDSSLDQAVIKHPQTSIFDFIMLDRPANHYTPKIFPTITRTDDRLHESNIVGIAINNYLKEHRGFGINPATFQLVYKFINPKSDGINTASWTNQIYAMYQVYPIEKCIWPVAGLNNNASSCHNIFEDKAFTQILSRSTLTKPKLISFDVINGITTEIEGTSHIRLIDASTKKKSEHFIANNNVQLLKGFNYFIFEAKPTNTPLYIFFNSENTSLFYKWLDKSNMAGTWSDLLNKEIKPIFSQLESTKEFEKLTMVVYSDRDQKVQIRWQHGDRQGTIYKGHTQNTSMIYKAEIGQIIPI